MGGGGATWGNGGGGGGGALLIASSGTIQLNGPIHARGGGGINDSGYGSGGAVRLVAAAITGVGSIDTSSGNAWGGGEGRVRFDSYLNSFAGAVNGGVLSQGSQFVVVPMTGSGTRLTIGSVAGLPVPASPGGLITTPDVVLSGQQSNPISIVVQCSNVPLNTQISVTVTPVTGPVVTATGYNNAGTLASSAATVSISIPRGGGLISAAAATAN